MNRKKTQRLYRDEGLAVRRRRARRRIAVARMPIPRPAGPNSRWSLDFVHDQLAWERRFRVLTIIDDVTKECLAAVPDTSLSGKRVVRELQALIARRGRPGAIVSDNGTEFTSAAVLAFVQAGKLDWRYIAPGNSTQNAFVPQRASLLLDHPRPRRDRRLGGRLQHRAAALGDRLHDAGRLRRRPEPATGIGSKPPRKLSADARCCRRAKAQFSTRDSSRPWMSDGGHVSFRLDCREVDIALDLCHANSA